MILQDTTTVNVLPKTGSEHSIVKAGMAVVEMAQAAVSKLAGQLDELSKSLKAPSESPNGIQLLDQGMSSVKKCQSLNSTVWRLCRPTP